ncbi:MAG: hypothetical protein KA952_08045 [Sediminibacterium sp.]|nr:hypothetical protein [Sediminibacterium sp.]
MFASIVPLRYVLILFVLLLIFFFPQNAKASEESMFFLFNEWCVQAAHNQNRIKAAAKLLKWEELSTDALQAITPADSDHLKGWKVMKDEPFLLFIGDGRPYGKNLRVYLCNVVSVGKNIFVLREMIKKYLKVVDHRKEESPLLMTYQWDVLSEANVGVVVQLQRSKEPSNKTVTLQSFTD